MRKTGAAIVILIAGLVLTGCAGNESKGNPYAYTPTASPEPSKVDSTLAAEVKQACIDQVNTVAKNAARKIANVPPKFYKVTATSFRGDVEQVELPREKIVYEIEFTYTTTHDTGEVLTTTQICRVNKALDFVELRNTRG
jgi:hypothetical protein